VGQKKILCALPAITPGPKQVLYTSGFNAGRIYKHWSAGNILSAFPKK
jgi:hypothetical protein